MDGFPQTDLSSSQDVVPDWSASKVNVEICEAALHTHETVPEDVERWIQSNVEEGDRNSAAS